MTLGTVRLAEENRFPGGGIAGHRGAFRFSLEDAEIFDEGFYRRGVQAAERWHTVGRNSVRNDLRQLSVGAILSLGRRGNVGGALAASAVESVTAGATIFECLTSFSNRTFILRWVILARRCTFDGEGECEEDGSKRKE